MCSSKNNEYLKTMEPMLYLMKLICAMPTSLKPQNALPSFISSPAITWMTVAWHVMLHLRLIRPVLSNVIMDKNSQNIVTMVVKGPGTVFLLFCIVAPMSMWSRSKKLQDYWNAWANFQLKYEAVSGALYVSRNRRYIKIATLICIAWITLRCVYAAWFHYHVFGSVANFTANSFLLFVVYVISFYWFANCAYFWSVSEDILNLGKKIIAEKKDDGTLNHVVSIWSTLNDLTKHYNEAHCYLYLSFLIMTVIGIVTYVYAILHYSIYKIAFPFTFYCNSVLIFSAFLILLCEPAHLVYDQTHCRQKEALLQENTMEMDPAILKSILSLCFNYLIVLQQFSET